MRRPGTWRGDSAGFCWPSATFYAAPATYREQHDLSFFGPSFVASPLWEYNPSPFIRPCTPRLPRTPPVHGSPPRSLAGPGTLWRTLGPAAGQLHYLDRAISLRHAMGFHLCPNIDTVQSLNECTKSGNRLVLDAVVPFFCLATRACSYSLLVRCHG